MAISCLNLTKEGFEIGKRGLDEVGAAEVGGGSPAVGDGDAVDGGFESFERVADLDGLEVFGLRVGVRDVFSGDPWAASQHPRLLGDQVNGHGVVNHQFGLDRLCPCPGEIDTRYSAERAKAVAAPALNHGTAAPCENELYMMNFPNNQKYSTGIGLQVVDFVMLDALGATSAKFEEGFHQPDTPWIARL